MNSVDTYGWMSVRWHVDDVHWRVYELGYDPLTNEEAREVLEDVKHGHDASIGINWDVIDFHIEEFMREKEGE